MEAMDILDKAASVLADLKATHNLSSCSLMHNSYDPSIYMDWDGGLNDKWLVGRGDNLEHALSDALHKLSENRLSPEQEKAKRIAELKAELAKLEA